ncbi:MAG: filamentous hemagglutinin family protein [Methylovulum sp.]|nr:filamentous hemagglutinin family protein [Methylovulum sp.]
MANKRNVPHHIKTMDIFRLRPLSACVRMAIAGSVFVGSISPVYAELPVPAQVWSTMGADAVSHQVVGDTLNINQHADRVILNWESFNVGAKNTVQFNQPGSSSIALNRIFQNDPSQILGKVTANGQIYLYNKNGFVFGKDSVVDVNTMVASTLNISDEVFESGIVRQFDDFNGKAALEASADDPKTAAIQVDAGANIHIAKNGRLIMAAPTVTNSGSITADEQGQIILVASKDKVYLQPAASDRNFAGLLVEVGSGGKVSNLGNIVTRQGNVTLAGFAVNQGGRITATTSVNINGSIRLLAREGATKLGDALTGGATVRGEDQGDGLGTEARVTLAPGSMTQIIADAAGGSAIDEQDQPVSYLEMSGHTIHMQSGSSIVAPGARVDAVATNKLDDAIQGNSGRIILENGARIDVSGTKHIAADIDRNVAELNIQTFELRDSPLQKGGVLQGQTVRVDLRKTTDIVDTSGAQARFERSIDERLGTGGVVNLTSSGDVVINNEAVVDISGGSIDYQDGYISTTKLLTDYGKIVDISDADPNEHYAAVFGVVKEVHEKWGVTTVWDTQAQFGQGRFEQGYTQGLAAGALNIVARTVSWNGDLIAGAASNTYQRTSDTMAFGGTFSLDSSDFNSTQKVVFQTEKNAVDIGVDDKFPGKNGKKADLVLPVALTNGSGIQKLSIKTRGAVEVAADANIAMQADSQFNIDAGKINVYGDIYTPSGTITLAGENNNVTENSGKINLGHDAVLDVSGRWVNDFALGLEVTPVDALAIDGGSIEMTANVDLNIRSGSVVRANGGAWLAQDNSLTAGKGGDISLAADKTYTTSPGGGSASAQLHLDGNVSAYGLSENGSLSLVSDEIIMGAVEDAVSALALGVEEGHFNFSKKLAFGEINLTSTAGDLTLTKGSSLSLIQQNRILQGDFGQQASGNSIAGISRIETLPEHLRNSVDLTLVSSSKDVRLETGSKILGDKEAAITLKSTAGGIFVDGLVDAPSGSINLSINANPGLQYNPAQAIWLGQHGSLRATGTTRMNPLDASGRRTGEVLDGGDITLNAQRGYVVLKQGSQIDVSGTHAVLDLPVNDGSGSGIRYEPVSVGSNAGKIALTTAEGAVLDGGLKGVAGSATTQGGRIDLALDRSGRNPPDAIITPFPAGDLVLDVVQADQTILGKSGRFGDKVTGALNGKMVVSADKLAAGEFSDLRLSVNDGDLFASRDEVRFSGDVNLTAKTRIDIDAPKITWSALNDETSGAVNLNTAYLRMGSSLIREVSPSEVGQIPAASGIFTANSQWIELGGASLWNGYSEINLNSAHDLRTVGLVSANTADDTMDYVGTMVTAANLNLTASQIYPSTLTHFSFAVENNPEGKITLSGNGNSNSDASPLSAAGILSFVAPVINQNGTVKAPFGTINLTASTSLTLGENSLTSVSGAGQLIPFGIVQGGLDWLYPLDSNRNLVFATPPEKKLVLSAPSVNLAKGSVVDLSGGGDLLSYEFLPGSGGSYDYLDPASPSYQGGFAVVPTLGSDMAPYDPLQSAGFDYAVGSKIYLSGTPGLPAGEYTILPARYALLPGAYLVTPQANTQDQTATSYNSAGLAVVAGYQLNAGDGTKDQRSNGYLLESGADIRKRSEYDEQKANTFYAAQAIKNEASTPILPMDSGQISISATDKLALEGEFKVASPGGRGARMDIAANSLKIVNSLSATPTEGTLEVLAGDLSALGVDSLFLGGARSNDVTTGATNLNVTAEKVVFDTGAQVLVTDLVAAATGQVEVRNGAVLSASGSVNTGDTQFNIIGDGALLRVSADDQIVLNRTSAAGNAGELLIQDGATLAASKSMLLDASQSTVLAGNIEMDGGSLNLSANAINIGEVSGLSDGALNLTSEKLQNLAVDELVLSSRDTVNFYGNVGQADSGGNLSAITFDSLVINAAGFSGFGSAGQTAKLAANSLQLQNTSGAVASHASTGQGVLDVSATNYTQGGGDFGINGFQTANINVAEGFGALGEGSLSVGGDLNVIAGYMTAAGGSKLNIDAGNHRIRMDGNGSSASPASVSFGGAINLKADGIDFNARVLLPSGSLGLQALTGDINIGGLADLNLAGQAVNFADTVDYTPGGSFSAVADHGNITLAEGSMLDLSTGGGTAKGGVLVLKALEQSVGLLGKISAKAGSAEIDVSRFSADANFDSLMNTLSAAGISDSIYFRSREADIVQSTGQLIKANAITLVADKGAMALSGTLNADGSAKGGAISLYAGDSITLANGAVLSAKGAAGGKVKLSSVDSDDDGISGINIQSGSLVDVGGATQETGGEVVLRALRSDGNKDGIDDGINIAAIAGTVQGYAQKAAVFADDGNMLSQGYSKFYAEGVKKYSNSDFSVSGEINSADIENIKADTDTYMTSANMQAINTKLGAGIRLQAGIEIDYEGDLALNSRWDLVDWKYNESETSGLRSLPGMLTINAGGNLALNSSLSDGFKDGSLFFGLVQVTDMLQTDDSWSYQLTAGADMTSADTVATVAAKDLTIGSAVTVRTGTGDIQLGAGGNIVFTDQTSTVYNAGRAEDALRYGTFDDIRVAFDIYNEYPVDGGDLVLNAGNNIVGAVSNQFINSWLLRFGTTDPNSPNPTAWGVTFGYTNGATNNLADISRAPEGTDITVSRFQQNIGSFGGGNVNVSAAGNIDDLSVMMPTSGKQLGVPGETNVVAVQGGGDMQVNAGGDVSGGAYYIGAGNGAISAGGEITGSATQTDDFTKLVFVDGPQLVMGDSTLSLAAHSGISITAVSDAMMLHDNDVNFFSYTDNSAIAMKSLSGDINLGADTSVIGQTIGFINTDDQGQLAQIYPASLRTTAFGGSVLLGDEVTLYPSASGALSVLANDSISSSGDPLRLSMSDTDPTLLPGAESTLIRTALDTPRNMLSPDGDPTLIHAATPVHTGDEEPVRLVAQHGDIKTIEIITPKKAIIQSGNDLKNVKINIQHVNADDVSIISAGRDVLYTSKRNLKGFLDNNVNKIEVAGTGDVLVKAGRNIDLGASGGLSTVGNVYNSNLKSKVGANITVLAGLNAGSPDYAAFLDIVKYADNYSGYKTVVTEFMRARTGDAALAEADALQAFRQLDSADYAVIQPNLDALVSKSYADQYAQIKALVTPFMQDLSGDPALTDEAALAAFSKLSANDYLSIQPQLNAIVNKVFFNELKESGSASAASASAGNVRGFGAIETLFPGTDWNGNLNLFFSKLQTLQGGDINLLVPGGEINAGLAVSNLVDKDASELGIVAQGTGNINAFVHDDFIVNQSRVFALSGGDILIWSSEGDIDAGRGAKSAISAPPPEQGVDENGNAFTIFPPIVSGSGIRTAATAGNTAGDVFLFAPKGVVNAGEAGIGGTNVTISATAVLGANNIQVGGVGTGVPVASSGSLAAGLTGVSNLTASVSQVAQASADMSKDKDESNNKSMKLGVLSVDVLGYGDGSSAEDTKKNKPKSAL